MAAPRKYDDEQRAAILELRAAGCSINQIIERCSQGIRNLAPFTPGKATVSEIVNGADKPSEIANLELADAFDQLARGAMGLVEREIDRLKRSDGALDADAMLKMAKALREIQPLAKPNTNGHDDNKKPKGLLGSLIADPTNGTGAPATVSPLRPNGHSNGLTPPGPDAA